MKEKEVVLITGCSSGIGRELCTVLSGKGYEVVATARNTDDLTGVPSSLALQLDVTDRASVERAIWKVLSMYGRIDILINNAGYSVRGALEEISIESLKKMFEVNLFGVVNLIQSVVPAMRAKGSGKIINIGSISGRFAQPVNGAYCASKHAVEAVSDALRYELHSHTIQVSVIEPGPIKTGFFKTMEEQSNRWMQNPDSAYRSLYRADAERKKNQSYAHPVKAAETICGIIGKKKLKARYEVVVPLVYRMLVRFPSSVRDYLFTRKR